MDIKHDLHLHTSVSRCAASWATAEAYMELAKENGLSLIGVSNHVWDTAVSPAINDFYEGQDMANLLEESFPRAESVRFLLGCEAELDKDGVLGLSEEAAKKLDFVLAVHSHSQHPEVIDPAIRRDTKKLANILCDRFSLLVEHPLAKYITAIAHPFFPSGNRDNFDEVLFRIDDERLENLFADANYKKIAIEINAAAFDSYPVKAMHRSELFRIYETAKECGCKFVFGSDCHDPDIYAERLERLRVLASLLEITEADLCPLSL